MNFFFTILFGLFFYSSCVAQTDFLGNKQYPLWTYPVDPDKKVVYSIVQDHLKDSPPYLMILVDKELWDTTLVEGILTTDIGYFELSKIGYEEPSNNSDISEITYHQDGTTTITRDPLKSQSINIKWKKGYGLPYIKLFTNKFPTLSFVGYIGRGAKTTKSIKNLSSTEPSVKNVGNLDSKNDIDQVKNVSTAVEDSKAVQEVLKSEYNSFEKELITDAIEETWGEQAADYFEKVNDAADNSINLLEDVYNGEVNESTDFWLSQGNELINEHRKFNIDVINSVHQKALSTLDSSFKNDEDSDSNFNDNLTSNRKLNDEEFKSKYRINQKAAATIFAGGLLIIAGAPAWPIIGLAALFQ